VALDAVDRALLVGREEAAWELFHENSKYSPLERHPTFALHPSDNQVVAVMRSLRRVKPYTDRRKVALPREWPAGRGDADALMRGRESARAFGDGGIGLAELAKVLHMAYGMNRDNAGTPFPRPFRAVPSGGALYPLELYVAAARVDGLQAGLYHFDPEDHELDRLWGEERAQRVAACFVQSDLAHECAAVVLLSAVFVRSVFKYGDRGYRFALIESGHVAQNAILCAAGLGLTAVPVGGYDDRALDELLGFDGLSESTIYALLLGSPPTAPTG
jgi:SagB-type dehydrogenase family enzyme